jgi:hypothetical protein
VSVARPPTSLCGCLKRHSCAVSETQCIGECLGGDRIHPSPKVALDVADRALADPSPGSQLGLGEPSGGTVLAELFGQTRVAHR